MKCNETDMEQVKLYFDTDPSHTKVSFIVMDFIKNIFTSALDIRSMDVYFQLNNKKIKYSVDGYLFII